MGCCNATVLSEVLGRTDNIWHRSQCADRRKHRADLRGNKEEAKMKKEVSEAKSTGAKK
jgi:hypothetical protein